MRRGGVRTAATDVQEERFLRFSCHLEESVISWKLGDFKPRMQKGKKLANVMEGRWLARTS
jgi:hypothetical protein